MSQTINKQPCKVCGSKDNLRTWEYEGKVITKCMTPLCTGRSHTTSQVDSVVVAKGSNLTSSEFITGEYQDTRGLTKETCKAVGIQMQGNNHIFLYPNAQKVRFLLPDDKKGMLWQGYHNDIGLFGEHLKYDYKKEIIITEGEFDMASCYQEGYQTYSIALGAGKGADEIKNKLNHLEKFKEIILWFDNDKAGKLLLKQVLDIPDFPLHKTRIAENSLWKDANDAFKGGDIQGLRLTIQNAISYIPEDLIRGDQLDFKELSSKDAEGIPFEFVNMQEYFRGFRECEILLIGAGSGAGKSFLSKVFMLNWMKVLPDLRLAFICLEEKVKTTVKSLAGINMKMPYWQVAENPPDNLEEELKQLVGKRNYLFEKHFGSLDSKKLFKKLNYLAHKSDVILIDHISILVSGMSSVEGERRDLDIMMTKIKSIAIQTGCRFIIISHLRRPDGEKSYETGLPISSNSFRGSGSLYQLSDLVMAAERNQQSTGKDKHKILLRGLKNRYTGSTGVLDELYFNSETGHLDTLDNLLE